MEIRLDPTHPFLTDINSLTTFLQTRLKNSNLHSNITKLTEHDNPNPSTILTIPHPNEQLFLKMAKSCQFQVYDEKLDFIIYIENLEDVAKICEADKNYLLRKYVEIALRASREDGEENLYLPGVKKQTEEFLLNNLHVESSEKLKKVNKKLQNAGVVKKTGLTALYLVLGGLG